MSNAIPRSNFAKSNRPALMHLPSWRERKTPANKLTNVLLIPPKCANPLAFHRPNPSQPRSRHRIPDQRCQRGFHRQEAARPPNQRSHMVRPRNGNLHPPRRTRHPRRGRNQKHARDRNPTTGDTNGHAECYGQRKGDCCRYSTGV